MVSFYWSVDCDAATVDPIGPWLQAGAALNSTSASSTPVWTFDLKINSSAKHTAFFTYQSRKGEKLARANSSTVHCRAEAPVVESRVECVNKDRGVRAMRKLSRDYVFSAARPPASLFLQTMFLARADLGATQLRPRQSQPTEFFIAGWEDRITREGEGWIETAHIPADVLSARLQTAINTFWDASLGNGFSTAKLSSDHPPSVCPLEASVGGTCADRGFAWNTTTATSRRFDGAAYTCHIPFALTVMLISSLLLIAASVSTVLGFITTAPDVLGYVSSAARDSAWFAGHAVPSHLSGLEAARLLRDVRVMIGDVAGKAEVGHVAFAVMVVLPQRLVKGRLYD
ncbi:hypothetical protein C7974DRAFT_210340 [Boeremia exigua]|uniref:uncharacterized protein n=1 Tax=Boeremia exigua TaxID=749465 RepID=UPI001E8CA76F|nr:uncharacterized protein C7974DRAFT_210340 [Boeremia exigua]KAH6621749.1 hypothetical protein C7974DRAFT_210340 [Boeremia exigua]